MQTDNILFKNFVDNLGDIPLGEYVDLSPVHVQVIRRYRVSVLVKSDIVLLLGHP